MRLQLSTIKPDIKESYKNVKQCHYHLTVLSLWLI